MNPNSIILDYAYVVVTLGLLAYMWCRVLVVCTRKAIEDDRKQVIAHDDLHEYL